MTTRTRLRILDAAMLVVLASLIAMAAGWFWAVIPLFAAFLVGMGVVTGWGGRR